MEAMGDSAQVAVVDEELYFPLQLEAAGKVGMELFGFFGKIPQTKTTKI